MSLNLSSLTFHEYPRADLRDAIARLHRDHAETEIPFLMLNELVDLACHAAATGRTAMLRVLDHASDPRVAITAVGPAVSLLQGDLASLERALKGMAQDNGLHTSHFKLEMTHG